MFVLANKPCSYSVMYIYCICCEQLHNKLKSRFTTGNIKFRKCRTNDDELRTKICSSPESNLNSDKTLETSLYMFTIVRSHTTTETKTNFFSPHLWSASQPSIYALISLQSYLQSLAHVCLTISSQHLSIVSVVLYVVLYGEESI